MKIFFTALAALTFFSFLSFAEDNVSSAADKTKPAIKVGTPNKTESKLKTTSEAPQAETSVENKVSPSKRFFTLAPKIETNFPTYLGAGLQFGFGESFHLDVSYGFVPEAYYNTIASVGADYGNEPAYEDLINAGFEHNKVIKVGLFYRLPTSSARWSLGTNYYLVHSEGRAEVDEVLSAVTGKDYTTLKNLLIAAGRDTKVDLEGDISVLEIKAGYDVLKREKWSSTFSFGIAKVLKADPSVQTGLKNFEASNQGKTFIAETESDIKDIIEENGLTPTLGIDFVYHF